MTSKNVLFWNN